MEFLIVRAPAKVILFGEHAVVYGKEAIAATVDLYTTVKIREAEQLQIRLFDLNCDFVGDGSVDYEQDLMQQIELKVAKLQGHAKSAVSAFLYLFVKLKCQNCYVEVKSDIPVGAGLGSSASYSVCIAAALLNLSTQLEPALDEINRWAFVAEQILHGNPSGVDNTVITYGGLLSYRKGDEIKMEHLKSQLDSYEFLLVDTKVSRSTKVQVLKVADKVQLLGQVGKSLLQSIDSIAQAFQQDTSLNELIKVNQKLLDILDAGHPSIDEVVSIAAQFGNVAKLTGSGGGGCVLVLANQRIKETKDALQIRFDVYNVKLGVAGVAIIQSTNSTI